MVSSVGGFNPASFAAMSGLNRPSAKNDIFEMPQQNGPDAKDVFTDYMKKTPAERMADNWLRAHGYTKEKLDAMTPEERDSVMKQMQHEIEEQLKQQTEQKGQRVNVLT